MSTPITQNLAIVLRFHAALNEFDQLIRKRVVEADLTQNDASILLLISLQPEATPMGILAQLAGVTASVFTITADRLAGRELAVRVYSRGDKTVDRRLVRMELTQKGRALAEEIGADLGKIAEIALQQASSLDIQYAESLSRLLYTNCLQALRQNPPDIMPF